MAHRAHIQKEKERGVFTCYLGRRIFMPLRVKAKIKATVVAVVE